MHQQERPTAGTGLLGIHAELAGAKLVVNESADTRAELLGRLFPGASVTRYDAATIHDHIDAVVRPSVVLMNAGDNVPLLGSGKTDYVGATRLAKELATPAEPEPVRLTGSGASSLELRAITRVATVESVGREPSC